MGILTEAIRAQKRSSRPSHKAPAAIPFRPDIEGLRAVAVVFVLVWHAGVPWLPGGFVGVDVFFVVSGFLMTSILHREMRLRGGISVGDFYARRARRLVPASAVALIATTVATFLILPETRWRDTGLEIAAAGGYGVNWLLAERAVDYLAQDAAPSPVQHFWSLSVEEQFYIAWPLLLVAVAWIVAKVRGKITATTLITLAVIAAGSLLWSIYLTHADQGRAYFVSTTRLWELALGGLVALSMPWFENLDKHVATALGWIGLAGIACTGFLLDETIPFPGAIALVPTISTALVIATGPAAGQAGPVRIWANKPVQWIGSCSYSIYLWHWPFIVIGGYWLTSGLREISVSEGVILAGLSVLPAWLSLRFVENPVRRSADLIGSVKNSLALALVGIIASLIAGLLLAVVAPRAVPEHAANYVSPASQNSQREGIGAEVLAPDPLISPAGEPIDIVPAIEPSPMIASEDVPPIFNNGCHLGFKETTPNWCVFGDMNSKITVALVGDSHAAHWLPALEEVALKRGWKLLLSTKSSCAFLAFPWGRYPECKEWNQKVLDYLTGPSKPAMLVVSWAGYGFEIPTMVEAGLASLQPVVEQGTKVVVIQDTPAPNTDLPECVAEHLDQLSTCATPREQAIASRENSQSALVEALPGAEFVDLTDWICPTQSCAAVIGGVIPFRDRQHLTATYSRSLAPALDAALPLVP